MSFNRNPAEDRSATRAVLGGTRPIDDGLKNWLGHSVASGAGKIDRLLIAGATKVQMLNEIEPIRNEVNAHLGHLRIEHGLKIIEAGDVLAFDRDQPEP